MQDSTSKALPKQEPQFFLLRIPPKIRLILGLIVIILMVIFAFIRPLERNPGDPVITNNLRETITINRALKFEGIDITIKQAMLATSFSDDRKRGGTYVVRIEVHTVNNNQQPIGIEYAKKIRLILQDGQTIAPKLVSVLPQEMPNQPQDGFFDFPVSTQMPLASLTLHFDDGTTIPFK